MSSIITTYLAKDKNVRVDILVINSEELTRTGNASLNLISNEKNIILLANIKTSLDVTCKYTHDNTYEIHTSINHHKV
jgi:hypothetical protein